MKSTFRMLRTRAAKRRHNPMFRVVNRNEVHCRRCGRALTAEESKERGIGVSCLVAEYDDARKPKARRAIA